MPTRYRRVTLLTLILVSSTSYAGIFLPASSCSASQEPEKSGDLFMIDHMSHQLVPVRTPFRIRMSRKTNRSIFLSGTADMMVYIRTPSHSRILDSLTSLGRPKSFNYPPLDMLVKFLTLAGLAVTTKAAQIIYSDLATTYTCPDRSTIEAAYQDYCESARSTTGQRSDLSLEC